MKIIRIAAAVSICISSIFTLNKNVDGLTYCNQVEYILCGEKAVITGFSNNPKTLILPSEIDGKTVTEIRENAFFRCHSLERIEIPESITQIGHHAFYCCDNLKTVTISAKTAEIQEGTFYGCSSLDSVTLPNTVTRIGSWSFYGCENLNSIALPESIIYIGEYSFYDCGFNQIYLPDNINFIGDFALGYNSDTSLIEMGFSINTTSSAGKEYAEKNNIEISNQNYSVPPNKKYIRYIRTVCSIICLLIILIMCVKPVKYIYKENFIRNHSKKDNDTKSNRSNYKIK